MSSFADRIAFDGWLNGADEPQRLGSIRHKKTGTKVLGAGLIFNHSGQE